MRETGLLISNAGDLQGWWVLLNYRNLISIIAILRSINLGFSVDSLVKSRIGERHCPFRKKGFDTGGVKNSKLFEELATSSWNLAAGVETPERRHRSEPI